jgi:hypothetical protein
MSWRGRVIGDRPLLVVHGHREGNAVGGEPGISRECMARVRAAERAARRARCAFVLFCGAGAPGEPSEAHQMAAIWRGPPVWALLDERSTDSAENADEALIWRDAVGASSLLIVSSWWHLRLALYYRAPRFDGIPVGHVRTRRVGGTVAGHLGHELRYAGLAWRARLKHRCASDQSHLVAGRVARLPFGASVPDVALAAGGAP